MPDKLPSLDELQHEIDDAKSHLDKKQVGVTPASAGGQAMQMATRFIAGAAIGSAGGYFLDRWLDTSPLFFIACFFIGFAAGLYSLMLAMKKSSTS